MGRSKYARREKKHYLERGSNLSDGSELTLEEVEFGRAMEAEKRRLMSHSLSIPEILAVVKRLGYRCS